LSFRFSGMIDSDISELEDRELYLL
jgi:hypothetical protein